MALTEQQYDEIRQELQSCANPLIFFHDDPDGLCSFLLLYRFMGHGKGVVIKSSPRIDQKYMRKVKENSPDKVFVVDIAVVEQEFIDSCNENNIPVIWIDHHGPFPRQRVKYYNPRLSRQEDNLPASYLCCKAVGQDIWLGAAGAIGDMYWPADLVEDVQNKYPGLIPLDISEPRKAMYNSDIGKLGKIMSFLLKGTASEAMKYVKVMSRINSPDEILSQTTSQGNFIYKKYVKIEKEYTALLQSAKKKAGKGEMLVFMYPEDKMSFTGDLANELAYLYPDKVIIIGREKSGEAKCSLRSDRYNIPAALEKAFPEVGGFGGGHEHAAGAVVPSSEFQRFLKILKQEFASQG